MNAKHSLCTISLVAALLCIAGEIKAQSRYERVLLHNLWNDGVGVNGIRQDSTDAAEATLEAGRPERGLGSAVTMVGGRYDTCHQASGALLHDRFLLL